VSYPKQDPLVKKYAICASVTLRVKRLLLQDATKEKGTVANFIGKILEQWAGDRLPYESDNVDQYKLFSRDQGEVIEKEATMYKEGPLGKEKKKLLKEGIHRSS
jgi:hypothetical protein